MVYLFSQTHVYWRVFCATTTVAPRSKAFIIMPWSFGSILGDGSTLFSRPIQEY